MKEWRAFYNMSKELLTPDKNKIIKLNAPDGEVSFNEDELLMIIQVCHNQLDRNIDCDKDAIHDYYHTAMTFKDPKILDSFGRLCRDTSLSMRTLKLLDEKLGREFICDECVEELSQEGKQQKH